MQRMHKWQKKIKSKEMMDNVDNVMRQKDPKPGKLVHALLNVSVLSFVFCTIWKSTMSMETANTILFNKVD